MRHSANEPSIIIKSSKVRDEEIKNKTNEPRKPPYIRCRQTQALHAHTYTSTVKRITRAEMFFADKSLLPASNLHFKLVQIDNNFSNIFHQNKYFKLKQANKQPYIVRLRAIHYFSTHYNYVQMYLRTMYTHTYATQAHIQTIVCFRYVRNALSKQRDSGASLMLRTLSKVTLAAGTAVVALKRVCCRLVRHRYQFYAEYSHI